MANKPITPEEMKAYVDATWEKCQAEAWQEPVRGEAVNNIRVRIMQEAYDLADRDDSEGYNSVKLMCSDVLGMINKLLDERKWKGLTADEIWQCNAAPPESAVEYHVCMAHQNVLDFAEAIEAKLKEKNT